MLSAPSRCSVYVNFPRTGGHAFFFKMSMELNVGRACRAMCSVRGMVAVRFQDGTQVHLYWAAPFLLNELAKCKHESVAVTRRGLEKSLERGKDSELKAGKSTTTTRSCHVDIARSLGFPSNPMAQIVARSCPEAQLPQSIIGPEPVGWVGASTATDSQFSSVRQVSRKLRPRERSL